MRSIRPSPFPRSQSTKPPLSPSLSFKQPVDVHRREPSLSSSLSSASSVSSTFGRTSAPYSILRSGGTSVSPSTLRTQRKKQTNRRILRCVDEARRARRGLELKVSEGKLVRALDDFLSVLSSLPSDLDVQKVAGRVCSHLMTRLDELRRYAPPDYGLSRSLDAVSHVFQSRGVGTSAASMDGVAQAGLSTLRSLKSVHTSLHSLRVSIQMFGSRFDAFFDSSRSDLLSLTNRIATSSRSSIGPVAPTSAPATPPPPMSHSTLPPRFPSRRSVTPTPRCSSHPFYSPLVAPSVTPSSPTSQPRRRRAIVGISSTPSTPRSLGCRNRTRTRTRVRNRRPRRRPRGGGGRVKRGRDFGSNSASNSSSTSAAAHRTPKTNVGATTRRKGRAVNRSRKDAVKNRSRSPSFQRRTQRYLRSTTPTHADPTPTSSSSSSVESEPLWCSDGRSRSADRRTPVPSARRRKRRGVESTGQNRKKRVLGKSKRNGDSRRVIRAPRRVPRTRRRRVLRNGATGRFLPRESTDRGGQRNRSCRRDWR